MASISTALFSPLKLPTKCRPIYGRLRPASAIKGTGGSEFGGNEFGLVDENMIVLRKRIHEMEVAERNYEPPSHWAEWEKQYYAAYVSDVCVFAGLVQALLLKTRPSLAIGMLVLTAMSVPASAVLIWVQLTTLMGG